MNKLNMIVKFPICRLFSVNPLRYTKEFSAVWQLTLVDRGKCCILEYKYDRLILKVPKKLQKIMRFLHFINFFFLKHQMLCKLKSF